MIEPASIALPVTVIGTASLDAVIHDAVLLAGRIASSLFVSYAGVDYLIHPSDSCPEGCPQCADRNPQLRPKTRDLRLSRHDSD